MGPAKRSPTNTVENGWWDRRFACPTLRLFVSQNHARLFSDGSGAAMDLPGGLPVNDGAMNASCLL